MTLLYEQNWRLPERRVELYEECVGLLTAEWDRLRGVTRAPQFSPGQKQQVLTQVAAQFHTAGVRVFEREHLLAMLAGVLPGCGRAHADPHAFLEELMAHTGLLRQKSRSSYDFVHLTFQEFFTARAFHEQGDGKALLAHAGDAWWREVIRLYAGLERDATALLERLRSQDLFLAAGCLADCRQVNTPAFRRVAEGIINDLQHLVCDEAAQRQDAADALTEIGGWGATEFLTEAVAQDERNPDLALAAVLALTRAADKAVLDKILADVGRTLRLLHGQLPRAALPLQARMLALLDRLGHPLVFVPAGAFLMGSNNGVADERPPHTVTLQAYWIHKFPVTNAQFDEFVHATGYQDQTRGDWRSAFTPGKEKHPVVFVTWEDAYAYARWCGMRLPTEAEWEKAARGTDGREYPWGNQWDGNRCNVSGRGTTPVGTYVQGVSPYGCYDMAGNVQEWCQDRYDAHYYQHSSERDPQGPDGGKDKVLRGGSWRVVVRRVRVANRLRYVPGLRHVDIGFRCAR